MPAELVDLRIGELSRVRRGANNRTHLLLKSEQGRQAVEDLLEKLEELIGVEADGEEELNATLKDAGVDEEGRNAAVAALRLSQAFADELDEDARREIVAAAVDVEAEEDDEEDPLKKAAEGDPEAREELSKLRSELEEAREIAEENRRERREQEFVAKAEQVAGDLPVDKRTLGQTLLALHDEGLGDEAETIREMVAALREQADTEKLFASAGRFSEKSAGDAYQELQKRARKRVEDGRADTRQQAVRDIRKDDPELASRVREEQGGS